MSWSKRLDPVLKRFGGRPPSPNLESGIVPAYLGRKGGGAGKEDR